MMSVFGESRGELTYSICQLSEWIFTQAMWQALFCLSDSVKGLLKETEWREWQLLPCNYFQQEMEIKYAERATICKKCLDQHRTMPQEWYYKTRPLLSFCWTALKTMPGKLLKQWGYPGRKPGLQLAHTEPEPWVLLIQRSSIKRHLGGSVGEEMMMMRMSGQKSGRGQILSIATGADGTGVNMVQHRLAAHHIIT